MKQTIDPPKQPTSSVLSEMVSITLDDLVNDPDTPELGHFSPIYLQFSKDKLYNGYLLVTPNPQNLTHKTCKITWWYAEICNVNDYCAVAYQFKSPNEWQQTLEELLGEASDYFTGPWNQTKVPYKGDFVTLADLKMRLFKKKRLDLSRDPTYLGKS